MARNKYSWIKSADFPEGVQAALKAFEACFWISLNSCEVTHFRDDAVFIQVHGIMHAYSVARFCANNPGIFIEIEAIAPDYFHVRLFFSEWMKTNEIPRHLRFLNSEVKPVESLPREMRCLSSQLDGLPFYRRVKKGRGYAFYRVEPKDGMSILDNPLEANHDS